MKTFKYLSLATLLSIVSCGQNGGNQETAQATSEESSANETTSQQASKEKKVNWKKPIFSINENKDTICVWTYNEKGLLSMVKDQNGITTYTYDNRDSILCINKNNEKEIFEYGENGRLKKKVSSSNEVTTYEYSDKKIIKTDVCSGYVYKTEFEYSDNDYKQLLKQTVFGEYGGTTTFEYFSDGRLKCKKYSGYGNDKEVVTICEYDAKNRLINNGETEYIYDDDKKTRKESIDEGRMYNVYDELGREIEFFMDGSEGRSSSTQYFDNYSVETSYEKTNIYEDNEFDHKEVDEQTTTTYYLEE